MFVSSCRRWRGGGGASVLEDLGAVCKSFCDGLDDIAIRIYRHVEACGPSVWYTQGLSQDLSYLARLSVVHFVPCFPCGAAPLVVSPESVDAE